MNKLSIRMRFILITAFLLILCCTALNITLLNSAVMKLDEIQVGVLNINSGADTSIELNLEMTEFYPEVKNIISSTRQEFIKQSIIITSLVTAAGIILTWFLSSTALKPLKKLSRIISETDEENLSEETDLKDAGEEINSIITSFNRMKQKLNDSFQSQKQFTANAAHELRTPLAVMQTNLEVFRKNKNHTSEEYDEQISLTLSQISRLSKLVNSLLELMSMHNAELNDSIEFISLTEELICDLEPAASGKNIKLVFEHDCDELVSDKKGNEVLVYRAIYNLTENAVKYSPENTSVTVSVSGTPSEILVKITDEGEGIPSDEQNEIFRPFYRIDKSRSRKLGGYGIGLALVREIMNVHSGDVYIEKSDSSGTVFCLKY